jgi:hypothetical protein
MHVLLPGAATLLSARKNERINGGRKWIEREEVKKKKKKKTLWR